MFKPNEIIKFGGLILACIVIVFVFRTFNPSENSFFYTCPIYEYTGLQCAGCGSQRAFHQLLHFHIGEAIQLNVLFVISIPFILLAIGIKTWNWIFSTNFQIAFLKHRYFYMFWVIAILGFAILRNVL